MWYIRLACWCCVDPLQHTYRGRDSLMTTNHLQIPCRSSILLLPPPVDIGVPFDRPYAKHVAQSNGQDIPCHLWDTGKQVDFATADFLPSHPHFGNGDVLFVR